MTTTEFVVAIVAVAIGALAQGSIGFGFGTLAAPVLAILDEDLVPGSVLVLGFTVAAYVAWSERGALDWFGIRWALVGRVIGSVAGAYAVSRLSHNALAVVLGAIVLIAVAISVSGWHVRPSPSTLVGAGALSGVMGTLTSVGGPPMALIYQREEAAKLRSTLAGFFLFGASLALFTLFLSGEFGRTELTGGLVLLPGLVGGLVLSRFAHRWLDHGWTRPTVLAMSAAAAVVLLVDAAT